jgi:hypothetical protein
MCLVLRQLRSCVRVLREERLLAMNPSWSVRSDTQDRSVGSGWTDRGRSAREIQRFLRGDYVRAFG